MGMLWGDVAWNFSSLLRARLTEVAINFTGPEGISMLYCYVSSDRNLVEWESSICARRDTANVSTGIQTHYLDGSEHHDIQRSLADQRGEFMVEFDG